VVVKNERLNFVKEYRVKANLLVEDLSKKTGIPKIMLHCIEAGVAPARIVHVWKLSSALGVPAEKLFPNAMIVFYICTEKHPEVALSNDTVLTKLENLGVTASGLVYTFTGVLKNGTEFAHNVDYLTFERLNRVVHGIDDSKPVVEPNFVQYQTESKCVLLNVDEIAFCHFLFEPDVKEVTSDDDVEDPDEFFGRIAAYLNSSPTPLRFGATADSVGVDIDNEVCGIEETQFQDILANVSGLAGKIPSVISFMDEDGEEVVLRVKYLSMMTLPIEYTNPSVAKSVFEEYCQSETRGD